MIFLLPIFLPHFPLSPQNTICQDHTFRYFQVRHLIQNHCPTYPSIPPITRLDAILNIPLHMKGVISNEYNTLMSIKSINLDKIRADWTKDLAVYIYQM